MKNINIDADIKKAHTLPSSFYVSDEIYKASHDSIFARCWQFIGDTDLIKIPGQVYPFTFLEGSIEEPLLLTRDQNDAIHCLSNVCTHRGTVLVENPDVCRLLQCRYHGRRFELNGQFKSMPEFDGVENFPSEEDNLKKVPFGLLDKLIFVSLNPIATLDEFIGEIKSRLNWFPFDKLIFEPSRTSDYLVKANWALYCENYLEGLHIPFVHPSLNAVLDYGSYTQEIYKYSNLQLAVAKPGEECFKLTEHSPDYGNEIAAYYYWIFPNMMFNFYPWGLSINVVNPLAKNLTKVSFHTYILDSSKLDKGAGSGLDRVEREDEAVVEQVQKGMQSRFYSRGRYSPKREQGVHHFHRLLLDFLQDN